MEEADRLTIAAGTPGIVLMERAGLAVAEAVAARRPAGPVVVVAGPGNNGGDGFVAARILAERGFDVTVALLGDRSALKSDAATAAGRWVGPVCTAELAAVRGAALVVDALFGAGLSRPVAGKAFEIIEAINAEQTETVAVDLPSGISGDTGAVMGSAIRATETVTFFRRKPGHLLLPGRLHCGKLTVADIGISASLLDQIDPHCWANEPPLWLAKFPRPSLSGHKYDRGHAVIRSGQMPTAGAAKLAARGALRAGAGLVTIASPANALSAHAAESAAVMVRQIEGPGDLSEFLSDPRRNSVLLGPGGGMGTRTQEETAIALRSAAAVVLDADALSSFADAPSQLWQYLAERKERPVVLTPHGGEFSRLFSILEQNNEVNSKLEKTREAASLSGAIVLLKGPDTVVAAPDGRPQSQRMPRQISPPRVPATSLPASFWACSRNICRHSRRRARVSGYMGRRPKNSVLASSRKICRTCCRGSIGGFLDSRVRVAGRWMRAISRRARKP